MKPTNDEYRQQKIAEFHANKLNREAMRPNLEAIKARQSANCPDRCVDKSKCKNPVHW